VTTAPLDAFRAELLALKQSLAAISKKTVRDEALRDRFRTAYRTWHAVVDPAIRPMVQNSKEFWKLAGELEALAQLASKSRPVLEYRKRLNRAIGFANSLVLRLPPTNEIDVQSTTAGPDGPFIPSIPDLPTRLVPNALLGWRSKLVAFVEERPFDKSVFIMIRYRPRNGTLVHAIKEALRREGYRGVLASDHNLTDDLYNPIACLLCCARGIAVFDEPEASQAFNPNVAYELGMLEI